MPKLHVPLTVRTVRLITFVLFICKQPTTRGAVFLLFTHGLSSNVLVLCLSKHTRLLKGLLHDSHGIRTWENEHEGTDNHYTPVRNCHVHIASFITRFAHIPFCHRPCNTYEHMVMTCNVIIKEANPFFGLYLSFKHFLHSSSPKIRRFCIL